MTLSDSIKGNFFLILVRPQGEIVLINAILLGLMKVAYNGSQI